MNSFLLYNFAAENSFFFAFREANKFRALNISNYFEPYYLLI